MILERIELENVGPFRERLVLDRFVPGLNVLAQRNEWGKSTVLKALTRAFFDKYSSKASEIDALRPLGSRLTPRVTMEFLAGGERFRLRKVFLDKPSCELWRERSGQWERAEESDRADQCVRALLGAPRLGGRIAKPETWGLVRFLWAHQDAQPEWPGWDGPAGEEVRSRLATVPLDPAVRAVASALRRRSDEHLTDTGRVRAGGRLDLAGKECGRLLAELEELQRRRAETEALLRTYTVLRTQVAALEEERALLHAAAERLWAEAECAEKQLARAETLRGALSLADEALQRVKKDEAVLVLLDHKAAEAASGLAAVSERMRSSTELPERAATVERAESAAREQANRRIALQQQLDKVRGLSRWKQLTDEVAQWRAARERAFAAAGELAGLERARSSSPGVSAAAVHRWRALDRGRRDLAAQLEVLGLRVMVTPAHSTEITVSAEGRSAPLPLDGGRTRTFTEPQRLELELAGWGKIVIVSGAREIEELRARLREHEATLARELGASGIASLADAEAALGRAQELEQQIKCARETLRERLGEHPSIAQLDATIARAEAALEQQRRLTPGSCEEMMPAATTLQRQEEELAVQLREAGQTERELRAQVGAARAALESARRCFEEATRQAASFQAEIRSVGEQRALVEARHAGNLPAALEAAQREFARAEARLIEARCHLPAKVDALPEQSRRATQALAEHDAALHQRRQALYRHEVLLQERGGEGLHTKEAALQENYALARAEAAALRQEACAQRLAAGLIARHEQSAIERVLGPLEDRLSAIFAQLTGVTNRRVFFDEHLGIRGIGPSAGEIHAFAELSRGAREQLLLALRAAIALELADEEPTCLILDDVLANTDAVRQQKVLQYLETLAERVQIVVLTCHAERYRAAGHLLHPLVGAVGEGA